MDNWKSLTPHDQKLLQEIEQIIAEGKDKQREDDSILDFCADLISTIPNPDPGFGKRLKDRLTIAWDLKYASPESVSSIETSKPGFATLLKNLVSDSAMIRRGTRIKRGITMKRGLVFICAVTLITASLTVAFVPSVQAAIIDAIKRVVLGANTVVEQIDPMNANEPGPLPPDMWIIRTEIGNFGGNAPPGVDPIVRSVNSIEEAQALTNFHLMVPDGLPDGYNLLEAKLAPIGATSWAILIYDGPGHDIIIAQMPGGPQPSDDPNVSSAVKTGVLTDGEIEEVEFDGNRAAWIEDHTLLWELEGISIEVGGLDLKLDEIIKIARSLH